MALCVRDNDGNRSRIGRLDPQERKFEKVDSKMREEHRGSLNTSCVYPVPCQPGNAAGTKIYAVLNARILQEQSVSLSSWYQQCSESCSWALVGHCCLLCKGLVTGAWLPAACCCFVGGCNFSGVNERYFFLNQHFESDMLQSGKHRSVAGKRIICFC